MVGHRALQGFELDVVNAFALHYGECHLSAGHP